METVLVTGGAGFIGSHTVDFLVKRGFKVVVVDNISTGKTSNLNKKAKFYKCSVTDVKKLEKIFKKERPKGVIHLAAQTNARLSVKNPIFDEDVNVHGTINVLECCRKFGTKKIVYASSAAVYGNPKYLPIDEKHPQVPLSQYGTSKYSGEIFIKTYSYLYGIDYVILRYSNVYGPRQNAHGEAGVIAIFSDRMKRNKPVCIFGDGNQTRDFIYVADVARANAAALDKRTEEKVFNISTGKEISINDLSKEIKRALDSCSDITWSKAVPGEVSRSCLDNSAMKKELGVSDNTSLQSGLERL